MTKSVRPYLALDPRQMTTFTWITSDDTYIITMVMTIDGKDCTAAIETSQDGKLISEKWLAVVEPYEHLKCLEAAGFKLVERA